MCTGVCRVPSNYKCESTQPVYCELDRYTPKLHALYRQKSSRTGKGAEALREMLTIYDLEVSLSMGTVLTVLII